MFAQEVDNSGGSNALIAAAQGTENFGPSMVTALLSFNKDKAVEYFGTTDADYSEGAFGTWPSPAKFEAAVGKKIAISVVENLTPNPLQTNPQPKINPKTGDVLLSDGSPIYRHTEIVLVGDEKSVLLKHNSTAPMDAFAPEADDEEAEANPFAVAGASVAENEG